MNSRKQHFGITRRESLQQMGTGLGMLGLAGIMARDGNLAQGAASESSSPLSPKVAHFAPRAKHEKSDEVWIM